MTDEEIFAAMMRKFPGAAAFWEIPDDSPLGAFPCVLLAGIVWAFDNLDSVVPRPIAEKELNERNAFPCTPESAEELLPNAIRAEWRGPNWR